MKWYLLVWRRFGEFRGRARRMEYWMFVLFYFITLLVLALAVGGFGLIKQPVLGAFCAFLGGAYALVALVPGLACAVRRLHDSDRSGWWVLLGPAPIAAYFGGQLRSGLWLILLLLGLALIADIVLLVFLALGGTPGDNHYGPDPKTRELPAAIG